MSRGLCIYCHIQPIIGRLRKYCPDHSRQASAIWKRQHPEWRTPWKITPEERRAYFRVYMRARRKRRREGSTEAEAQRSPLEVCLTCRGALKLQARLTRLDRAAADHQEKTSRLLAEARWFVLALERVKPCAGHNGVTRLAHLLITTLERRGQSPPERSVTGEPHTKLFNQTFMHCPAPGSRASSLHATTGREEPA